MNNFGKLADFSEHPTRTEKVAFVHDWLVTYAGSERVLEQMLHVYPNADIFTLIDFIPKNKRNFIKGKISTTSFLQKFPFAKTKYRTYLPFMPLAIEQLDVSGYDLIISSSHAVAKGVITGPGQLHLCMCYSPIRYAWDLQHQYLRESRLEKGLKSWIARWILHKIRMWDYRSAAGVDGFIAISDFIARRIRKTYQRESTVIYPPVDVAEFTMHKEKDDFFLTASRMVPYKRIDLIIDAFNALPDKKLVVIGDGPDFQKNNQKAGKNVQLLGYQSTSVLKDYLQRAKAFIFAAEEDFGIAPLEAQASGTSVIAFGKGGALETIKGQYETKKTGLFFYEQSVDSLRKAVLEFEALQDTFLPEDCRQNALRFSPERFREEFKEYVEQQIQNFREGKRFK